MWSNNTTEIWPEIPLYGQLINTVFYLALLPVATVGNTLAIVVVSYIIKHHRTRRFIPDMALGVLASVDLFSVTCVHSLTVVAMWNSWPTLPNKMCVFQAFSSSVYLKLQFLVQVTISLDRYFALVWPLKYHSVSSAKTMKIVLSVILVISVGTTALTMAFAVEDIVPLQTWQFCVYEWRVRSATDYALVGLIGFIFSMGFIAFIGSNVSLVRILWRYHARRGDAVLREISNAVGAMDKDRKPMKAVVHVPELKELKEPSSQNECLLGAKSNNSRGANKNSHVGTRMDNDGGICCTETGSRLLNVDRSMVVDQSREGKHQSDAPSAPSRDQKNNCVWNGNSMLRPPSGNYVGAGQTLDMADGSGSGGGASSCVSSQPPGVIWKLGGSDIEESSALLGSNVSSPNGHREISPQTSTATQDQSPNTGTSFLADTSDQEDLESPLLDHANIPIPPAPLPSTSPQLDLLAMDRATTAIDSAQTQQMLPLPVNPKKMQKSLSANETCTAISKSAASTPSSPNPKLPKSVSFHDEITTVMPTSFKQQRHSSSSKDPSMPQIQRPSILVPPKPRKPSGNQNPANHNGHQTRGAKVPQGTGDRHDHLASPHLASSDASSSRNAQLAFFQHQVKRVLRKMQKKAHKHQKEMVLARLVLLCAVTFVITWLPYVTVIILSVVGVTVAPLVEDLAIKTVFANAMLNPIFYGLCRRNYRKGYDYVSQLFCYRLTCGLIKRPGEDKVFYESKQRTIKRHQQAAEMDAQAQQLKRQQRNACALQILQHTLHLHSATLLPVAAAAAAAAGTDPEPRRLSSQRSPPDFTPSKRLQDLFQQYIMDTDSDTDSSSSSSVDYDALVFGEENLYQSLKRVWSICINTGDLGTDLGTEFDADIDLDIDYDALLGDDIGADNVFLSPTDNKSETGCLMNTEMEEVFHRMAMSTPNFERLEIQEEGNPK